MSASALEADAVLQPGLELPDRAVVFAILQSVVAYADPGTDTSVPVAGRAAEVDDAAKKRALWSKLAEACSPAARPIRISPLCK